MEQNEQPQITVFIGFDERQPEAFDICKESILQSASVPVEIIPLNHKKLRSDKMFWREWGIDASGQYFDKVDGKPFSTQFSHSRFLVPELSKGKGRWSVFVDSDFVFFTDIAHLIQECAGGVEKYPVYVVKHNYDPKADSKMDNCVQAKYNMKLWTSLMVFDNQDPANQSLTKEYVNKADGRDLHQFKWLSDTSLIGEINEAWNFIPNHSEKNVSIKKVNAIHYTEGTPHMEGYENCRYSDFYWSVYTSVLAKKFSERINLDGLGMEPVEFLASEPVKWVEVNGINANS